MADPRFCSNCGNPLSTAAKFCGKCGKPVQNGSVSQQGAPVPPAESPQSFRSIPSSAPIMQPAAPQVLNPIPVQAQVPGETVVGVIPGVTRHSGFLGVKTESFILVLTNLRILFAAQSSQMMQENIKRARDDAREGGKGFFGQWGAQFGANSGKQYMEMDPQQILSEQPTNFYIYVNQLRSIRLREDHGDEDSVSTYSIEFDMPGGKQKFRLGAVDIRGMKKRLQQYYGNIVR